MPVQAATKLCNQALAKYTDQPLFTILKAFALDRAGNDSTVPTLIQQVIDCPRSNDDCIHHAGTLLKGRGEFDKMVELYEKAAARAPKDLTWQQQLFLAHARVGDTVKQQRIAMQLNKADPMELHALWVVCSILLQADARRAGAHLTLAAPAFLWWLPTCHCGTLSPHAGDAPQPNAPCHGRAYEGLTVHLVQVTKAWPCPLIRCCSWPKA